MSFNSKTIDYHFDKHLKKLNKNSLVLDLGTSKRMAKELENYKDKLKTKYFALGYNPQLTFGNESCDINGDILYLPFKSNSADLIICLEVIEHVINPFKAIDEIFRVTKAGGYVFLTTPFLMPYHGKGQSLKDFSHGGYPDFWRFTFQGLEVLFKNFSETEVIPFSNTYEFYANRFLKFNKFPLFKSKLVQNFLSSLQIPKPGVATHRHLIIAKK